MPLLPSQKVKLFNYLEKIGLTVDEFTFTEKPIPMLGDSSLCYKTTWSFGEAGFLFEILDYQENFLYPAFSEVKYTPGADGKYSTQVEANDFNTQSDHFAEWVLNIKHELPAYKKWNEFLLQKVHASKYFNVTPIDNENFSEKDIENLREAINHIKDIAKDIDSIKTQLDEFDKKMDHMIDVASKLSKVDFKNYVVGTITSIIVNMGVDTSTANNLYNMVMGTVNTLFLTR